MKKEDGCIDKSRGKLMDLCICYLLYVPKQGYFPILIYLKNDYDFV